MVTPYVRARCDSGEEWLFHKQMSKVKGFPEIGSVLVERSGHERREKNQ